MVAELAGYAASSTYWNTGNTATAQEIGAKPVQDEGDLLHVWIGHNATICMSASDWRTFIRVVQAALPVPSELIGAVQ